MEKLFQKKEQSPLPQDYSLRLVKKVVSRGVNE